MGALLYISSAAITQLFSDSKPIFMGPQKQHVQAQPEVFPVEDKEWECILHSGDNKKSAKVSYKFINTEWQNGWKFRGIPELDGQKVGVSIHCEKTMMLRKGSYKIFSYQSGFTTEVSIRGVALLKSPVNTKPGQHATKTMWTPEVKIEKTSLYNVGYTAHKIDQGRDGKLGDLIFNLNLVDLPAASIGKLDNLRSLYTNSLFGQDYECKKHVDIPGSSWYFCRDTLLITKRGAYKCVVYSVGISNIHYFDDFMGGKRCDVFSFDCTVKEPENLNKHVTFYPYCLSDRDYETPDGKIYKSLESIKKELDHENRVLDILKLDCEGCEYLVLSSIPPIEFQSINQLLVEFHIDAENNDLDMIATVASRLKFFKFKPFQFAINRGGLPYHRHPEVWVDYGVPDRMCCVEYGFVRHDLLSETYQKRIQGKKLPKYKPQRKTISHRRSEKEAENVEDGEDNEGVEAE